MRPRNCGNLPFRFYFPSWVLLRLFLARFPATPSDHAFRRAIRVAERLSQACSICGSAPNDPAHAKSRFLDSVQKIVRLYHGLLLGEL